MLEYQRKYPYRMNLYSTIRISKLLFFVRKNILSKLKVEFRTLQDLSTHFKIHV